MGTSLPQKRQKLCFDVLKQSNYDHLKSAVNDNSGTFSAAAKLDLIKRFNAHPWMEHWDVSVMFFSKIAKSVNWKDLEPEFDALIEAQPRKGYAAMDVAEICLGRKQWTKALAYLQQAKATKPTSPLRDKRIVCNEAVTLYRMGKKAEAKELICSIAVVSDKDGPLNVYRAACKEIGVEPKKKLGDKEQKG